MRTKSSIYIYVPALGEYVDDAEMLLDNYVGYLLIGYLLIGYLLIGIPMPVAIFDPNIRKSKMLDR